MLSCPLTKFFQQLYQHPPIICFQYVKNLFEAISMARKSLLNAPLSALREIHHYLSAIGGMSNPLDLTESNQPINGCRD